MSKREFAESIGRKYSTVNMWGSVDTIPNIVVLYIKALKEIRKCKGE